MKKNKQGIAFILVLVVAGLVTMMLATFITINRQNFNLLGSDRGRQEAYEACNTAYGYAMFRIEHDRYWGVNDPDGDSPVSMDGVNADTLVVNDTGTGICEGTIPGTSQRFTIQIVNNFEAATTSKTVPNSNVPVPPECAYLLIEGGSGMQTRRVEALVRKAAWFDSSAQAGGNMNIDVEHLWISSLDPYRNLIRSKEKASLPDSDRIKFNAPANDSQARGTFWSQHEIDIAGVDVTGLSEESTEKLQQAQNLSGGSFLGRSNREYEVPELSLDHLNVPTTEVTVPSGDYTFERLYLDIPDAGNADFADVLVRRATGTGAIEQVYAPSGTADFDVLLAGTPGMQWRFPEGRGEDRLPVGDPRIIGATEISPGVNIHYALRTVEVREGLAKVDGPFSLSNASDFLETNGMAFAYSKASLLLGHVGPDGTMVEAGLKTTGGDLKIDGTIVGFGAVATDRNLNLVANTFVVQDDAEDSNGQADVGGGVALFADGDINISANNAQDDATQFYRGLIYAGGDFNYMNNTGTPFAFYVQGALVAHDDINISRAGHLHFNYDRKVLTSILKEPAEGRMRVERVLWKS